MLTPHVITREALKLLNEKLGKALLKPVAGDRPATKTIEIPLSLRDLNLTLEEFSKEFLENPISELAHMLIAEGLEPNAKLVVPNGVEFAVQEGLGGRWLRLVSQYDVDHDCFRAKFHVRHEPQTGG
jgi:hypothetical protein